MFEVYFLDKAKFFLNTLHSVDKNRLVASISSMRNGNFELVRIKTLKGKVRELIVKDYRITFFVIGNSIYCINGFVKKSQKTPKHEIDYAEKIYKLLSDK